MKAGNGRKLYLAYGSNLHKASMKVRCPSAKPVGKLYLTNARLVFRSVADVEYTSDPEARVPVGVWSITRECELSLNRYEGVSIGVYDRYHLPVGEERALMYMMRDTGIAPPGAYYYDIIEKGYRDFGLDTKWLREALRHSHAEKNITRQIRERRERSPSRHGNVVSLPEEVAITRVENRDIPIGRKAKASPIYSDDSRLIPKTVQ